MLPNTINTPRLILRPITPIDQIITDDFLGTTPAYGPKGQIQMAILTQDNESFVGTISLSMTGEDNEGEIDIEMNEAYREKAFHQEATQAFIKHAFEFMDLNRVYATQHQPTSHEENAFAAMGLTRVDQETERSTYDIFKHEYIMDE